MESCVRWKVFPSHIKYQIDWIVYKIKSILSQKILQISISKLEKGKKRAPSFSSKCCFWKGFVLISFFFYSPMFQPYSICSNENSPWSQTNGVKISIIKIYTKDDIRISNSNEFMILSVCVPLRVAGKKAASHINMLC